MDLTLETPIQYVPRVGPVKAKLLDKLGVKTVLDLLYYIPFRYNDFSIISPIARVQPGETVTVTGTVQTIKNFITKTGKRIQEAKVADSTDTLTVIWFNQPYLIKIISPGDVLHLSGQITWFGNKIVMSVPVWEKTDSSLHTGRIVPVYSETEGITSKWLRGRMDFVLQNVLSQVKDFLPETIREPEHLMRLPDAISEVHFPKNKESAQNAKIRLSFDELLLLQLRSIEERRNWQNSKHANTFEIPVADVEALKNSLPFELTGDQEKAIGEIFTDLTKPVPMNRLLVGDVGSGKTVVSALAMYVAFRNGKQSLLMAPTQILAHQHYDTISRLLSPFGIRVGLVTAEKREGADILVGTHALLSKIIPGIGLVVIDEQQRFGVGQRAQLLNALPAGRQAHLLTMTATPIPRTIARVMFGNIDLSVLSQMPKGRKKIKTWVVPKEKRENAYVWIKKHMHDTGGQTFIICPLIEESETLQTVRAVTSEHKLLTKIFHPYSVGLLHGRMTAQEKTAALNRFRLQKDAILLATPVVEVGIDIPNASIMMIEAAERFGLAQLHQLRGRVGRGRIASFCLLFTEQEDELTIKRLKALETVANGPQLSEIDLQLRGPGEVFGKQQHGFPMFRFADFNDKELIERTRNVATRNFSILRETMKIGTIKPEIID